MVLSLAGCPFHLTAKKGLRYVKPYVIQGQQIFLAACSCIGHLCSHPVSPTFESKKASQFAFDCLTCMLHDTAPVRFPFLCHAPIVLQHGYNFWMQADASTHPVVRPLLVCTGVQSFLCTYEIMTSRCNCGRVPLLCSFSSC
jgi:hypothetical protein